MAEPQPQSAAPPGARPRAASGTILVAGFAALAAALAAGLIWWSLFAPKPESMKKHGASKLPILGTVPAFELRERSGGNVALDALRGRVWIADFIFTRCSGPCLTMSANMAALQKTLFADAALADKVRLVSISVDPEWDTREALASYADRYQADRERWLFLTGGDAEIQSLAKEGFKLGTAGGGESGEPIIHSQSFVLVDGQARIRGRYDGTNAPEVNDLMRDIKKLAAEEGGP